MPTFAYKARSMSGEAVSGTVVAETATAASRLLDERSLMPVELNEVATGNRSVLTGKSRRVPIAKVGMTYEQLADLLRSGVPILRALNVLSKQSGAPALAQILREVHDDVAGGDALADAMEKHPNAFPDLHVAMVRAGEKGGFIEDVLTRMSEFVTRADALKNKLIGSLIYPCILLLGGFAAIMFIILYIVPKIRTLIEDVELPWTTKLIFALNDLLTNYYMPVIGVIVVVIVSIVAFFRSAYGQQLLSRVQLGLPFFGPIYTMVALCRFCRIFGTLLANGIPILQALRISKDSAGNHLIAECIDDAAEHVSEGESLAVPLGQRDFFPLAILDMIAVAEESNTLEKVLVEIADTQEERTARKIDLFVRMLEPALLALMGMMVMFIAISLLLPILKLSTSGLK